MIRLIKRYESRKLYDTEESRYVSLDELATWVRAGQEVQVVDNATGAGLYDRVVLDVLRRINDPYPYARGLICEIGFPIATVPFIQPRRTRGVTSQNFYTLYDLAMLGITKHSKVPLRLMAMLGFGLSCLSLLVAFGYLLAKLLFWDSFELGLAPVLIGMFFFGAMQLFFLGLLGEYIGAIQTQVRNLPLVVEAERINFGEPESSARDRE